MVTRGARSPGPAWLNRKVVVVAAFVGLVVLFWMSSGPATSTPKTDTVPPGTKDKHPAAGPKLRQTAPWPSGVPRLSAGNEMYKHKEWPECERFSDDFLMRNNEALAEYVKQWKIPDPLHCWSRCWEYPFVLWAVTNNLPASRPVHVVDLGSGVTFIPYLIRSLLPEGSQVTCVDFNPSYPDMFRKINAAETHPVKFVLHDMLLPLPLADSSVDAIFTISVIEHFTNGDEVSTFISEVRRVLKPGGVFIVTLDIPRNTVSPHEELRLLKIRESFTELDSGAPGTYRDRPTTAANRADSITPRWSPTWSRPLATVSKNISFSCHVFVKDT